MVIISSSQNLHFRCIVIFARAYFFTESQTDASILGPCQQIVICRVRGSWKLVFFNAILQCHLQFPRNSHFDFCEIYFTLPGGILQTNLCMEIIQPNFRSMKCAAKGTNFSPLASKAQVAHQRKRAEAETQTFF